MTIVGGGVAALEALIALRRIAQERVALELVTPTPEWAYQPLAVAEPFGLGEATRYDLVRVARDHGATMHLAGVQAVRPDDHELVTWDGRTLGYELLLLAIGARAQTGIPGSVTIKGPGYTGRFRTMLRDLEGRRIRRVAFAVPAGASWPLPLYELALMTAAHVAEQRLRHVELTIVTPEEEPLELFGPAASKAMRELLGERGVALHTHALPRGRGGRQLRLVPEGSVCGRPRGQPPAADRSVAARAAARRRRLHSHGPPRPGPWRARRLRRRGRHHLPDQAGRHRHAAGRRRRRGDRRPARS